MWLVPVRRQRPIPSVLVVCPPLLLGAAVPAVGLLGVPVLLWSAARSGEGALLAFGAFAAFFLGVAAYAFGRAAIGQQVRCRRREGRLEIASLKRQAETAADQATLAVQERVVGWGARRSTVHVVTIVAPGWPDAFTLYMGPLRGLAARAARRLSAHLDLRYEAEERSRR